MPRTSKAVGNPPKLKTQPRTQSPEKDYTVAEEAGKPILGQNQNPYSNNSTRHTTNAPVTESVVSPEGPSPYPLTKRQHSILDQVPQAFQSERRNNILDDLEGLDIGPSTSNEEQLSADPWSQNEAYGSSPQAQVRDQDDVALKIAGSPPNLPGHLTRGGFSTRSPPISPPQRSVRPVSFSSGIPPLPTQGRNSTSPYGYLATGYGSPQALPHLPQPHFYGAHDVDLGISSTGISSKSQEPSFVKFAPLPEFGHQGRTALFRGFPGELNILSVDATTVESIGSLRGLSGTIIDATFLSWDQGVDPFEDKRPLVAVTVYGPSTPDPPADFTSSRSGYTGEPHLQANPISREAYERSFSTRVEVYSLSRQKFVVELLRCSDNGHHHTFPNTGLGVGNRPEPFDIQASGNYLTITSGISGEIYLFGISSDLVDPTFQCLGKFWTASQARLQRRDSSNSRSSDADDPSLDSGGNRRNTPLPISALRGRWLAYCPTSNPLKTSIGARIGDFVECNNLPNLNAGTSPSKPSVNCEVDSPDADTFLGKVARGVAQEVVRSTKWLGEKGYQTWQNYWSKDSNNNAVSPATYASPSYTTNPPFGPFPPTHAGNDDVTSNDLVAIVDLKTLQYSQKKKPSPDVSPFAIFQPPSGCSFLSFSPNGLSLLTASKKGDLQYVWDLKLIKYARATSTASENMTSNQGARVRQIAKYERLSPSTIVDVAWDSPTATRFALLTLNRTVHIFDLPSNAYKWPPNRSIRKNRPTSAPVSSPPSTQHDLPPAGGFLASAINIASRTQPILANIRERTPSMTGGFAGFGVSGFGLASATGARGSKAVAAGLSKSLGAASETVTSIRHAGQSRLHLKINSVAGRLIWNMQGQTPVLLVLDPHHVKQYSLRRTKPREARLRESVTVFDARKAVTVKLDVTKQLGGQAEAQAGDRRSISRQISHDTTAIPGFWRPKIVNQAPKLRDHAPLSHAEIDTTAPYQPFHLDDRVSLSIYDESQQLAESELPTASAMLISGPRPASKGVPVPDQWVFGQLIPSIKLNFSSASSDGEETALNSVIYRETTLSPGRADGREQQIVSTTRKRKPKRVAQGQNEDIGDLYREGFFEDDCDVLDFAEDRPT